MLTTIPTQDTIQRMIARPVQFTSIFLLSIRRMPRQQDDDEAGDKGMAGLTMELALDMVG